MATITPSCALRLARDLREVQSSELRSIAAEPVADDIRIWRVSLTAPDGPYKGVPFHMVMNFPDDYPAKPPRVQLCTGLPHPNVFEGYDFSAGRHEPGWWLCLNMLRDSSMGSYSGWSGAYSVLSILVQLQSFLFAENIDQDYGYSEESEAFDPSVMREAYTFHEEHESEFPALEAATSISMTGEEGSHTGSSPGHFVFGDFLASSRVQQQQQVSAAAATSGRPALVDDEPHFDFENMPEDVLLKIADTLSPEAVSALFRTCKATAVALGRAQLSVRRELLCFYSKVSFTEAVLGFGFHVEHGGYQQGGGRHIKHLSTELELLSHEAFTAGVRTSVWKTPFELWMPVLLSAEHTERALPLVKTSLMAMAAGHTNPAQKRFDPLVALTVLPKLLNQMTVQLMSVDDSTSLHASEKALLGFTSFHHLLLRLATEYPIITERAQFWVKEFIRSPARRNKLVIHDLGEFLVLLYLCPEGTWARLSRAFLEESFVRNVRWVLDKRSGDAGELATLEPKDTVSEYRLTRTLNAAATSRRLLMFQVFFLLQVATPAGKTAPEILQRYEQSYGRPPPGTAAKLQVSCREILGGPLSWPQFFSAMGVALPTKPALCNILRTAMHTSEMRGYHSSAAVDWKKLGARRAKVDKDYVLRQPPTDDDDANSDVWSSTTSCVSASSPHGDVSTESRAASSSSSTAAAEALHKLFIAGLKPEQTEEQLRQLCCSFGRPAAIAKQPSARFAFVWFSRADEAEAALQYLRDITVNGRRLRVERSRGQPQTRRVMYGQQRQPTSTREQRRRQGAGGGSQAAAGVERCPYPVQSGAAKQWYLERGRHRRQKSPP